VSRSAAPKSKPRRLLVDTSDDADDDDCDAKFAEKGVRTDYPQIKVQSGTTRVGHGQKQGEKNRCAHAGGETAGWYERQRRISFM
jgi:hypothetical protein